MSTSVVLDSGLRSVSDAATTGIDTTFLIDLEVIESPRHEAALSLFEKWRSEQNTRLAIYEQTFLEFQHVMTDAKRFEKPLTMEQALECCWFWIDQERVSVIHPDNNSLKRAQLWMNMHHLGRKRLQDTHMAAAFAENGVSRIITANPKDFEVFGAFELISY